MYKHERKKFTNVPSYAVNYAGIYSKNKPFRRYSAKRFSDIRVNRKKHFKFLEEKVHEYLNKGFRFFLAFIFIMALTVGLSICVSTKNSSECLGAYVNYNSLIWPVVMHDPEPFCADLPPNSKLILDSAIWSAAENKKNGYSNYNENSCLIITLPEVKKAALKLFGSKIDFENICFSDSYFYKFNPYKKEFFVECISGTSYYMPRILSAELRDKRIILKVAYITPANGFSKEMDYFKGGMPEKIMTYGLEKDKLTGEFYISFVK